MIKQRLYKKIVFYSVLGVIGLIFLSPFIWSFFTSLKTTKEIYSVPLTMFPKILTVTHYVNVISGMPNFPIYFRNSVVVSFISVILVVPLSSLAGYALGCFEFKGKGLFLSLILLVLALPWGVYLIPIYIMEDALGLIDTNLGLILPYTALNVPLATFILRGTFRSIPSELEDAAIVDGCSSLQRWYLVMLPLARNGVAAATIFTFIMIWGEFMYARTLMLSTSTKTLPVGITELRLEGGSWAFGTLSTTIILSIIPTLILFLLMQRYFVRAILEGSLKG